MTRRRNAPAVSVCPAGGNSSLTTPLAIGPGTTASGVGAAAIGESCQSTGVGAFSCCEGCGSLVEASFSAGYFSSAQGKGSCAAGYGVQAGNNANANKGDAAFGQGGIADGGAAFVCNLNTHATGEASFSSGINSQAPLKAQRAHASGQFVPVPGDFGSADQWQDFLLMGQTPGAAAGETVVLSLGGTIALAGAPLTLLDGYSYTVVAKAIASGKISGTQIARSFIAKLCLVQLAGVISVYGTGTPESFGSAAAGSWALTFAGGASLLATFSTGSTTAAVNVECHVEMVQAIAGG